MIEKEDGPSDYILLLMEREDAMTDYVIGKDYRNLVDQALEAEPVLAEQLFFRAFSMFLTGLDRLHADPKQYERWNEWGGNRKIPGGSETIMNILYERYESDLFDYGHFVDGAALRLEGSDQSLTAQEYRSRFDNVTHAIGRCFGQNRTRQERIEQINKAVAELKQKR